jgi:hydrogenase expression/formation protein HypE
MPDSDAAGKISQAFMERIIFPNLGAKRAELIVGPAPGIDTCQVDLGGGKVLVASTDPLSLIPRLGTEESAWMSINLLVNDLATSGVPPQFLLVDLNLPPSLSETILASYWKALSAECDLLGISIIGGNTGKFEGCDLTILGAGTTLAIGSLGKVVASSGAKIGDKIIVTKGAAISTTGLLSRIFSNQVAHKLGLDLQQSAASYFGKIPVLKDSMLASSVSSGENRITAMHDVAEGGVLSGMFELAEASRLGMKIEKDSIPVSDETSKICDLFGIDPYWSLGEGALIITCAPEIASTIINALATQSVSASIVGDMVGRSLGVSFIDREESPVRPSADPYWNAYYSAMARKWD